MPSCSILSVSIITRPRAEILRQIQQAAEHHISHHVITANSIMLRQTRLNPDLAEAFRSAHMVIADSVGVVWAAKILGEQVPSLMPGIDLMEACLNYAVQCNMPVYFIGGKQSVIEQAVDNIRHTYPSIRIAGYRNGYFTSDDEESLFADIQRTNPAFVFVGIDSPRQEIWISRHMNRFPGSVVMGIGGSFDVVSGKLKRAPRWMRNAGLEWLFRVFQEPYRLWRVRQLPAFAWHVIIQKLTKK